MRRVWNWMMMTRILDMIDARAQSSADVDNSLAEFEGPVLEVARLIRFGMDQYISLPEQDSRLLAAARQYAGAAPAEAPRIPGTLLVLAPGRLALALDQTRTIESYGLALCIVADPSPGRYTEAWEIPGVIYWGGQ